MDRPKIIDVSLDLKILKISGRWEPNKAEQNAAWELYVELVTRTGVVPVGGGLLREAMSSLYSIFNTAREILRRYGPEVASPKSDGQYSFGYLSVAVLNFTLRPILSYWHPELESWEVRRSEGIAMADHEASWPRTKELRAVLEAARSSLVSFASILATACAVPDLLNAVPGSSFHSEVEK